MSADALGVDDWSRECVVTGAENVLNQLMDLNEVYDNKDKLAKILAAAPDVEYIEFPEIKSYRWVPQIAARRERHPKPSKLREWERRDGMHDAPLNIVVVKREKA